METVAERLRVINERMAQAAAQAGRRPQEVRLLAVAKTASDEDLLAAWDAGQTDFAHNRVQPLERAHQVLPEANWHLVGPLQSNKVRRALRMVRCVQTVGDTKIYTRLRQVLDAAGTIAEDRSGLEALVQVNLTPEDGRYGCRAAELPELLEQLSGSKRLNFRGLMTLAPHGAPAQQLHRHFSSLRELAQQQVGRGLLPPCPELSMGMSNDFEIAIAEGATLVRIGRAIFPPR